VDRSQVRVPEHPTGAAELSRRRLLRAAGGIAGGALAVPLLDACAPAAPNASPTRPAAVATSGSAAGNAVFPSYLAATSGPKADFVASGPMYDDAFSSYPPNPVKALPADPPGTGGTVNIMSIQLFPPPTVFDQNPAWQAVNKALNANVQFQIVTSADYPVKLGTVMAGNDLPDLLYMYSRPGASSTLAAAAGVPQFLQSQAADLTPYLSGDAARDYPNLAAIPTQAWKNAGCAYQGHLYMIPIHRYLPSFMWLKNATVYDKEFGADYVPRNADDFKRILQTLTRPQQDFYGISGAQQTTMWVPQFSQLFGAPNDWRLEPGGKLTKDWETPEYRETVAYVRDLYASGVFHPNSTTFASGVIARAQFSAGKFGIWLDPINGWQDAWRQALQSSQPFDVHLIPPFPAHDGGKPQHNVTGGHLWATALKKGTPDRIKELLRIMNWLAAPFGSAEDQLLTFGVSGVDYTLDGKGNPALTQQGNTDANYVPWKYTIQHPFVFFTPDIPSYAQVMNEAEKAVIPFAVSNPTFGQVSATNFSKGFNLTQSMTDGITDIVVGRRPLTDYDQLLKDWQANGGETIRKEYMDSIANST
jgi:putative aldouronate transport system substrate-binding protein